SSLSASRQLPPPGKAPMRLNASSWPSNRSRSIRGDVGIPAPWRILVQAAGPVYHGCHEFRHHTLEADRTIQGTSGCRRITFWISTMGDQMAQFRRVIEDVLPYLD